MTDTDLLAEADKHAVKPPQHIRTRVGLSPVNSNARHQDGAGLLVHAGRNGGQVDEWVGGVAHNGCDPQTHLGRQIRRTQEMMKMKHDYVGDNSNDKDNNIDNLKKINLARGVLVVCDKLEEDTLGGGPGRGLRWMRPGCEV